MSYPLAEGDFLRICRKRVAFSRVLMYNIEYHTDALQEVWYYEHE